MTFEQITDAATEIRDLLRPKECENVERLQYLSDKFGHIPVIKDLFSKDYDRRVSNPGFGAPNCSCHIMPPCQACVDYSNAHPELF